MTFIASNRPILKGGFGGGLNGGGFDGGFGLGDGGGFGGGLVSLNGDGRGVNIGGRRGAGNKF